MTPHYGIGVLYKVTVTSRFRDTTAATSDVVGFVLELHQTA